MNKSSKNISITFIQEKKAPGLAISLCFPCHCNFHCLRILKSTSTRTDCASRYSDSEMSALAFAVFDSVREKLMGSVSDVFKSKVSHMDCEINGGSFVILWTTFGSFSAMRQTICKAVASLCPSKVYSKYAENMRIMGMAPHRETFAYVANEMSKSVKSEIDIVVVGRANLDNAKLDVIAKSAADKFPKQASMDGGVKPDKRDDEKMEYSKVKASGSTAFFTADYIDSELKGSIVYADGGNIVVINKSFETKRDALKQKDRIKRFVMSKYGRVKNNMHTMSCYLSVLRGFNCSTTKSIIKSKPSVSDIINSIHGAL